jgi:hypothetical protein
VTLLCRDGGFVFLMQTPSVKGIPTHAGLMYKWLKDYKLSVPDKTRTSVTVTHPVVKSEKYSTSKTRAV